MSELSLKGLFDRLHDYLRNNEGIVNMDAMRDICSIMGIKMLEPILSDHEEPGKIDLLNPEHYDESDLDLLELVKFSDLLEVHDNDIFLSFRRLWLRIFSIHPITGKIYNSGNFIRIRKQTTLETIIKEIEDANILDFDHDVQGEAYEHFLSQLTTGKSLGQHFTNRKVVRFMIDEVKPEFNKKVYDPCCGTGGFLTEVYKYWRSLNIDDSINIQNIQGSDIQPDTLMLANINLLITTGQIANLEQRDTIRCIDTDPASNQYDYILTNPPFGLKVRWADITANYDQSEIDEIYPHKGTTSVSLYLQNIVYQLTDGGKAAVILPYGQELISKSAAHKKIRLWFLRQVNLSKVVLLPKGTFEHTGVETCILFFEKGTKTKKVIFQKFGDEEPLGKVKRSELKEKSYSLNHKDYFKEEEQEYNTEVEIKTLGEICEFLKKSNRNASNGKSEGKYPFFTSSDKIKWIDEADYNELALIIGNGGVANINICDKFSCSSHVFPLKVIGHEIYYVYYYIKYNINKLAELFTGITIKNISKESLKSFEIPVPSLEYQKKIIERCDNLSKFIKRNKKQIQTLHFENKQFLDNYIQRNEYEMKQLGEICEFLKKSNRNASEGKPKGKYPFFTSSDKIKRIDEADYNEPALIIGNGGIANINICKEFSCSSHAIPLKVPEHDLFYIYFYIKYNIDKLSELFTGITIKNISKESLKSFEIPILPIDDQKYISKRIGTSISFIKKYEEQIKFAEGALKEIFDCL